ncbi:MAG: response regulator, partial [Daejeonella sp.]
MKNILVIENDETLKESTVEILKLSGYGVLTASDGKKGVEIAVKENPDLIICDILIPNLDGFGVLKIISLHPKTSAIPFILITGINELDDQRKGMNLGADDYLIKPFTATDLLNVISIRLKKSENLKRNFHNQGDVLPDFLNIEGKNNSDSLLHEKYRDPVKYKKKHLLYVQGQRPTVLYYILKG